MDKYKNGLMMICHKPVTRTSDQIPKSCHVTTAQPPIFFHSQVFRTHSTHPTMREIRPYHPTFDVMRYLEVHYKARPLPMPDPSDRQDIATLLGLNIPKEGTAIFPAMYDLGFSPAHRSSPHYPRSGTPSHSEGRQWRIQWSIDM